MKKVLIQWFDIFHEDSWADDKKADEVFKGTSGLVQTIGFVVKESKQFFLLSSGIALDDTDEDKYFDLIKIPKGCVKKIKVI